MTNPPPGVESRPGPWDPPGSTRAAPSYQSPSYRPPYQSPAGQKAATTSLVCGIVGLAVVFFLCFLAFASVVLGIVAVRQAAKARREAAAAGTRVPSNAAVGRGLGIASIVLGSLATVATVVTVTLLVVGAVNGWFDTGERPRVVACQPTEGGTRVTVELVAGSDETLTYDYTLEVRDRNDVISQLSRTVDVRGFERETVLVPIPNGRTCAVTSWSAS